MRDFSKVSPRIWRVKKFMRLSVRAKLLFFALLHGPHAQKAQAEFADSFPELVRADIVEGCGYNSFVWLDLMGCKSASRGAMTGRTRKWIPRIVRDAIFARDSYSCKYCGSAEKLQLDHIVPYVKGGTDDFESLVTACKPCNTSKGAKTLSEWGSKWLA